MAQGNGQKDVGTKGAPVTERASLLGDVLVPIDRTLQELTPEELRAIAGGDGKPDPIRCWRFED
mgnify:CR=1 FL=1